LPSPFTAGDSCSSSGQIAFGSIPSTVAGQDIPYQIYLPPCYGLDSRNYPTLYLLHGGSYDQEHWTNLGLQEAVETGINTMELPPLLIVMPGGGQLADTTSGGPASYEGFVLNELIPYIENHYCASGKSADRAIGGISRGGYWALEIAFRFPETFAGVGGHSAALLDAYAGPEYNPQFTGINNDLADLHIYLDIGDEDWVINNIRQLHEDLVAKGIEHTWVLNTGSHDDVYWSAHVSDYLAWYTAEWSSDRLSYASCQLSTAD
jgi:enterochelin esterase-like enzyme